MATPRSIPEWTDKRRGTLLIVGSAACVYHDIDRAKALRPYCDVLVINGAGQLVEHAQHLLCGHGEKAAQFIKARKQRFPDAPPIISHGSRRGGTDPNGVDFIWEHVSTGGTSAWKAVRIGKAMGYEELILCGCPIDDSGYAPGESNGISHECKRIGHGEREGVNRMFHNYRRTFAVRARGEGQGVYSMSGYSRDLLGEPPGERAA